jgi:hypothetical protein
MYYCLSCIKLVDSGLAIVVLAAFGYDCAGRVTLPAFDKPAEYDAVRVLHARIDYYSGTERVLSCGVLRKQAALLYQLSTEHCTQELPGSRTLPVFKLIALLPKHLALKTCCVATLCPALPLKDDFA